MELLAPVRADESGGRKTGTSHPAVLAYASRCLFSLITQTPDLPIVRYRQQHPLRNFTNATYWQLLSISVNISKVEPRSQSICRSLK